MADAARYHRLQLLLALLGLGISLAYLLAALLTGAGHAVAYWAARATSARWGQIALVALLLGAGHGALGLPVTLLRSYWLPRRFGLLHQALGGWLADRLKAMLIGGALGLADDGLRERLLALARRAGVDAIGVFVADQSRKSRTANAAVVGLGRTRRIILFDTLLADFPPEEIESVLAHELGHHVHGDIRRGLLLQGMLTLVSFGLAALSLDAGVALFGLAGSADPAGLPWLALVALALGLVQLPLGNSFSRWIERQADDFALAATGNAPAFIGAMERLARLNLAERRPSRLKEIVLYSHPALERRIARATMDRVALAERYRDDGRSAT